MVEGRLEFGLSSERAESRSRIGLDSSTDRDGISEFYDFRVTEMLVSSVKSVLDCHWQTCRAIPASLRPCVSIFVPVLPEPTRNARGLQPPGYVVAVAPSPSTSLTSYRDGSRFSRILGKCSGFCGRGCSNLGPDLSISGRSGVSQ